MNNIKITVELCKEDRQRLDSIIELLGGMKPNCHNCTETALRVMGENLKHVQTTAEPQEAPEQSVPEINHPADVLPPHGDPEPVAEPEPPKFTKADILAKVQKLAGPNNPKREQAKAIVKSYGAKVSDIPEDKYAEVMDKLTALEG
jgi:hypothetical protein